MYMQNHQGYARCKIFTEPVPRSKPFPGGQSVCRKKAEPGAAAPPPAPSGVTSTSGSVSTELAALKAAELAQAQASAAYDAATDKEIALEIKLIGRSSMT